MEPCGLTLLNPHNRQLAVVIRQKAITTAGTAGKYRAKIEEELTDTSATTSRITIRSDTGVNLQDFIDLWANVGNMGNPDYCF